MKTKITLRAVALLITICSVALLSSCSTSNQLTSQNPHYHLKLVKADKHPFPSDKTMNETTTADIAPLPQYGSLTALVPDNQLKDLNKLLKNDMKVLSKQVRKSNPEAYQQLKTINVTKTLRQLTDNSSKISRNTTLSVTKTAMDGGGGRYFGLWLTFLIIAVVFFIFTLVIPILYIFGLISLLAAAIFFILWIVSLAS